jgi:anaerobic magnesium-protoporphyrin IX monomethyl ester cyclase
VVRVVPDHPADAEARSGGGFLASEGLRVENRRVLLVNPVGWDRTGVNLGLAYLSSALRKAGFETLVLDPNRFDMDDTDLVGRIDDFSPGLAGISVKSATAREGARVASVIAQSFPDCVLVAGGPHVTLCARTYLDRYDDFHFGIAGEAEESLVLLVNALYCGQTVESIPGLAYRHNGRIVVNAHKPPKDLDSLPLPDMDSLDGLDWCDLRYPLITSRGCPFKCIYCCANRLTGSTRWRARDPYQAVDELENVAREKGIECFEILDDNFTLDMDRAKRFCRELIRRGLHLSWYCHAGIRADRLDRELAGLMKRAGCTSVAFGIESGHSETYAVVNKGEPLSAIVDAVEMAHHAGMEAVGYFLIGIPGDTLSKFAETVRFERSLELEFAQYGMLVPYPGTPAWEMVQRSGKILYDVTDTCHFGDDVPPIAFETPSFPREDMIRAFYIARYWELFEEAQKVTTAQGTTRVEYVASPEINEHLEGMIIAAGRSVCHKIAGEYAGKAIGLEGNVSVPDGFDLSLSTHATPRRPKAEDVDIRILKANEIRLAHLLGRAAILCFRPSRRWRWLIQVKNPTRTDNHLPFFISWALAMLSCIPSVFREYGRRRVLGYLMRRGHTALSSRLRAAFKRRDVR